MHDPVPEKGMTWELRPADPDLVDRLSRHLHCPPPIARLLVSRGISSPEQADVFFEPTLSQLHLPDLMLGMRRAVARIEEAVAAREPILIYGDYDVDGTIATVLLKTAIERITPADAPVEVTWHVPHRIREGYGMQSSRLSEAAAAGIRLVISVDTGIRAFAAAAEAKQLGLDLIVTDHHLPDEAAGVPEAVAVLNPAQPGCPYPFKSLCGAAVAFKLAHALLLAHTARHPDPAGQADRLQSLLLPSFLKMVAIATIADSVPLVGENRVLASLGLKALANPIQPGLRQLLRVADLPLDRAPTAAEVGFRIAPRINAAGRMDIADDVIELFLTRSVERAGELAAKLDGLNQLRRTTERGALDEIEQRLADVMREHGHFPAEAIVFDHPDWHRGVLGILASRIVDRTGRPALVLTHEDQQAHGSGRSVDGFHLLEALTTVHSLNCERLPAGALFTRFGGHAYAVGFSLPSAHIDLLRARLRAHAGAVLEPGRLVSPVLCDVELPRELLDETLCDWVERCGPFGNGHLEPVFFTRSLTLSAPARIIKDRHICLSLTAVTGGVPVQAMGWSRRTDWPSVCRALALEAGSRIDLAYRLERKCDQWFNGLELNLIGLWRSQDQSSSNL